MHFKSLLIGFVLGAAVAVAIMLSLGDKLTAEVAGTTQDVGRTVQKAGEAIEKQGEKLH